jgi:hypothetical protein
MNHVLPNLEALNPSELKALVVEQHQQILMHDEQLQSRDAEIEHLKLLLAKLRRMQFGRSSGNWSRAERSKRSRSRWLRMNLLPHDRRGGR